MNVRHMLRRGTAAVAAGVLLAGICVAATAGPAAADAVTAGEGLIGGPTTQILEIDLASNQQLLMTVNGASSAQGALINVYPQTNAANGLPVSNQLWQFVPDNGIDDVFQGSWGELKNVNSGQCLNVAGGSTAELQQLIQWPCVGSNNEEFKTVATGSKTFGLASQLAGVYIGENNQNCLAGNNTPVLTRASYGNPCTDWTIQRVGGQPITLPNGATTSEVIDSNNSANNWYVQTVTETANTSSATQTWYLQRIGNLTVHGMEYGLNKDLGQINAPAYRIVSIRDNDWADATCLEVPGNNLSDSAEVETYGCDANTIDQPNQVWILAGYDDLGGGSGTTLTALPPGIGSGQFLMFNAALLGAGQTTLTYPALSIVSTIAAFNGSQLAMQPQNATVEPRATQLWRLAIIPPAGSGTGGNGGSGGSGTTPPHCVGFACLLG